MLGTRKVLLYPLVVATLPNVFLWAENTHASITLAEFMVPFAVVLVLTSLLLILLRLVIKDDVKVSIVASILLAAFFSYGAIHSSMESHRVILAGQFVGRHRYLLAVAALIVLAGVWITLKSKGDLAPLARAVVYSALVLVLFNGARVAVASLRSSETSNATADFDSPGPSQLAGIEQLPDIYYMIFDTYAREDVLETVNDFDNSQFVQSLEDKGFYFPPGAKSNYPTTALSLFSSLRMRYMVPDDYVRNRIADNEILNFVHSRGYLYVHLDSGFGGFSRRNPYADIEFLADSPTQLLLSDYGLILLYSTAMPAIASTAGIDLNAPFAANTRNQFNANMEFLRTIPDMPESTFTFNHNFPPHQPAIFDRDGNPPEQASYQLDPDVWPTKQYTDEIFYLNKRIEEVVDDILENSPTEPVIIIQGDHGSRSGYHLVEYETTGILNAYYLPEYCRSGLYPTITPVNTFRMVFNSCLGANFDLLEDTSYRNQFGDRIH